MNDRISSFWANTENLVARNRFKREQQTFLACVAILLGAGFVALIMMIRGGILS